MTPRERVLTAVARRKPDKVPKDLSWGFTPPVLDTFRAKTGCDDPNDYFDVEIRFVGLGIPEERQAEEKARRQEVFGRYYQNLPPGTEISEWGTAHIPGTFYHFTRFTPSMRRATSVADLESYPFPDFEEEWRRGPAVEAIRLYHERDLAVGGAMATTIFEVAWQIRGMEELLTDFVLNPEMAEYLLDRIAAVRRRQARFFAENDVDVLILGDDVSMQKGMIMSPATWRQWFKGRMADIIAEARKIKPGLPVFYHSDGNPSEIIPELIEIGITILNPVQPECIDPVAVKEQYGDHLSLWGTIGTQSTMPLGTPDEVRAEVKKRIETVGYDGGLVLGPTHSLEPDVPWENIVALYEAIEEYGRYD